jgi:hypothetical protein
MFIVFKRNPIWLLIFSVFLLGVLVVAASWLWSTGRRGLLQAGMLIIFFSYLLTLIRLYWVKVDVYSRGGWIRFRENPWSYRLYFTILGWFWLIPTILFLSSLLVPYK